jgi:hypothetical protein
VRCCEGVRERGDVWAKAVSRGRLPCRLRVTVETLWGGESETLAGRGFEFVFEDKAVGSPAAGNREGRIVEGG